MSLGAYSIIRYSDDLSDQRINLGVIVWHPRDGFAYRCTKSLGARIKAVNQRALATPIKEQLAAIEQQLQDSRQRDVLDELSCTFREGLQVSRPYPARFPSLQNCLDDLFAKLVPTEARFVRPSSQRTFEKEITTALQESFVEVDIRGSVDKVGTRPVNGVSVDVGLRVTTPNRKLLWRMLSLHAKDHAREQIAEAKATALDILTVRQIADFRNDDQFVVLRPPKPSAQEGLPDAIAWLQHECDEVFMAPHSDSMKPWLTHKLKHLYQA